MAYNLQFKRKYEKLKGTIAKADQHLEYDPDKEIDLAYDEDLVELIAEAEELLDKVDKECDEITAEQDEERRREAQIAKVLPRSQPLKWDGSVNDFIRFKKSQI